MNLYFFFSFKLKMNKFLLKDYYKNYMKNIYYAKYELHYTLFYYNESSPIFDFVFTIFEIFQIMSFPLSSEV